MSTVLWWTCIFKCVILFVCVLNINFKSSIIAVGLIELCWRRGQCSYDHERGTFKHPSHQSTQTGPASRGTVHRCPDAAIVTFWWGMQASGKSTSQGEHQNTRTPHSMFCLRAFDRPSMMSILCRHTRSVLVYRTVSKRSEDSGPFTYGNYTRRAFSRTRHRYG